MSNIFLCSDLHTNFYRDGGKDLIDQCYAEDVDIAIVAGDLSITVNDLLQDNIKMFCDKYPEFIFVTGNHDYYHNAFRKVDDLLKQLDSRISNFHFLNNDRITLLGHSFVGATLWFPRNTQTDSNKHMLDDFRYIKDCDPIVYQKHKKTIDFFEDNIKEDDIVITHHMPTYKNVGPKYKNSPLNCYFACDLDDMIRDKKPSNWFCGHSHIGCSYLYYSTYMVANPFGYPGENSFYNNSFIIRI